MTTLVILGLLAPQESQAVLEAPLRLEETAAGKDVLRVSRGLLRIFPEGVVEAELATEGAAARRRSWRPGTVSEGPWSALEVWGCAPGDLERRFAVTVEGEPAGGAGVADSEGRVRGPVRVRWRRGARAAVGPEEAVEECLVLRLVPREGASKARCLRAWIDPGTGRPRTVVVEEEAHRWVFVTGPWRAFPLPVEPETQADFRKEER